MTQETISANHSHHQHGEDSHHQHGEDSHHQHGEVYRIVINGEETEVRQKVLSFQEICELAFPQGPFGGNVRYTVTYSRPNGDEGSMVSGDVINIESAMVFYVGNTDRS